MNDMIQLYSLIRAGASIYIVRLGKMDIQPGPPGQQTVSLQFQIEEILWGESGKLIRHSEFTQPESEINRLKFPDPIWGRVNLQKGMRLFLITHELTETPADPLYVEGIAEPNDPVLNEIRSFLIQEQAERNPAARKMRYLDYLTDGTTVQRLFGAEALAKDGDLPEIDQTGQVALAMAATFTSDQVLEVRLNVGTWMWNDIYLRTNLAGRVAIINATIAGLNDPSEDVRRFSLDHLAAINSEDLYQPGVISNPEAIYLLQKQLTEESSSGVRNHLLKLIDALRT